ncbi:SMI1/KNR4 family protein [Microbulbifer sp. JMSA004]|uniref:SMI1/KNR4 family protein n=1 Tax=unclassified Microbulbifer TaxID=2619833 RepID=UPI00403B1A74
MKIFSMPEKASEDLVSKFEGELGYQFPGEYRDFLIENNVCSVDPYGFFYKHTSEISSEDRPKGEVGIFYGFTEKEERCIDWMKKVYVDNSRIPKGYFPIAVAGGGNNLCICVDKANFGKVYFWNHEA